MGYLNGKAILVPEQLWYYVAYSLEDMDIHTFLQGISPDVNVIKWLEFKLTYYDAAIEHFNCYGLGIPCKILSD